MSRHWALESAEQISGECIEHRNYNKVLLSISNELSVAQPGEVIVIVGPSRVGKSRAVTNAVAQSTRPRLGSQDMPFVSVQAENASTSGAFSTKAFTQAICRAIRHPIYGLEDPNDQWGTGLHARLNRTPEAMLRDAVEQGLAILNTRYLIIDEAHHVGYAGSGGSSALAVLDSWKCLANKTSTVLCLVGSYQLLSILACAPHLLGRQRSIHFPRYRSDDPDDVIAFARILKMWSASLRFTDRRTSLLSWHRLMLNHSFGCIGHLSKWLRSALCEAAAGDLDAISDQLLRITRHPAHQEEAIVSEIEIGENALKSNDVSIVKTPSDTRSRVVKKAFQRKTCRFDIGGRV